MTDFPSNTLRIVGLFYSCSVSVHTDAVFLVSIFMFRIAIIFVHISVFVSFPPVHSKTPETMKTTRTWIWSGVFTCPLKNEVLSTERIRFHKSSHLKSSLRFPASAFSIAGFSGRKTKTHQNVCVFKRKRISMDGASGD